MARRNRIKIPDLTDVEGGGFRIIPGEYEMKVVDVKEEESQNHNNMIVFYCVGKEGVAKNKNFKLFCPLTDEMLWKLKQTLTVLEVEIPEGEWDFDPDDVIGATVIGIVTDSKYRNQFGSEETRSQLQGFVIEHGR
jgi:hypothetical protein